jgi:hypothetical protein
MNRAMLEELDEHRVRGIMDALEGPFGRVIG